LRSLAPSLLQQQPFKPNNQERKVIISKKKEWAGLALGYNMPRPSRVRFFFAKNLLRPNSNY